MGFIQLASSALLFSGLAVAASPAVACSGLQAVLQTKLANTTVTDVSHISSGLNLTVPAGILCPTSVTTLASVCRVQATIHTSNTSETRIEVWLPDVWHGRFLGTGNGGITYADLALGSFQGFATVGSNAGHDGVTAEPMLHHPERIIDFAYRSIVAAATIGKEVTRLYYGEDIGKSYHTGCSVGGRQAFKMAQDFPDLFDGIIGGSPAFDWNHYQGMAGKIARILQSTAGPGLLAGDYLKLVTADVLAQCDHLDGVVDGVIDNPDACDYRPERLLCTDEESQTNCLNVTQVFAVRRLFEPFYGTDGQLLFPRLDPGMTGSPNDELGPGVYSSTLGWYRYVIFNDTEYDFHDFSTADIEFANKINPGGISSYNFDIRPFAARGGRLLSYHGTQDQHFGSGNSRRYYNGVARVFNTPSLDGFWRHFQIPGMQHCAGGPGAWQFGQSQTSLVGLTNTTEANILLAIVEWVEGGKAPDVLVGTKFVGDNPQSGVQAQRTHCRYPLRSMWDGSGNTTVATSWRCVSEEASK